MAGQSSISSTSTHRMIIFSWKEQEALRFPNGSNRKRATKSLSSNYPNSFLETDLDACLKRLQADTLIVCGMMTHICVDTTVRAAMDYGYQVKLVADACAAMNLKLNGEMIPAEMVHKAFIAALDGVFATIV